MTRIGIISAMPVELEGIIEKFAAKEVFNKGFYKIFQGSFSGHDVILACSGIGKVNAAACTQKLIDIYQPDYVINMGIAGGIAKNLKTLDVIIGSEVIYHDFTPLELLDKYYPFSRSFTCDKKLVSAAQEACNKCPEVETYHTGRIASGDCFVEDAGVKARIRDELNASCCEMEGAAIGHVCYLNKIPFLIIRSISDLADEEAKMSYEEFEKKASIQSNRIVEGIVSIL